MLRQFYASFMVCAVIPAWAFTFIWLIYGGWALTWLGVCHIWARLLSAPTLPVLY